MRPETPQLPLIAVSAPRLLASKHFSKARELLRLLLINIPLLRLVDSSKLLSTPPRPRLARATTTRLPIAYSGPDMSMFHLPARKRERDVDSDSDWDLDRYPKVCRPMQYTTINGLD